MRRTEADRHATNRVLFVFFLFTYAVVVQPLIDGGLRNYLVLFSGMFGAILIFARDYWKLREFSLTISMCAYMCAAILFSGEVGDLGSVALTLVFACGYVALAGTMYSLKNDRAFIAVVLRGMIFSFALLSIVQMLASMVGLPVPNLIGSKGLWSYNSLALEPSQLGRVVGITMIAYLIVVRGAQPRRSFSKNISDERMPVAAFLLTMILSGSALAILAIPVIFVLSRSGPTALVVIMLSILLWPLLGMIEYDPIRRSVAILSELDSLNVGSLLAADGSGAARIIPSLIYYEESSAAEAGFWVGYGPQGLSRFFLHRIPGFGDVVAAGFIPGFAVVYGVFGLALFTWIYVARLYHRRVFPVIVFWLLFICTSAWNTQVFWYGLMIIYVVYSALPVMNGAEKNGQTSRSRT